MPTPKPFFQDRLILLILTINTFLAVVLAVSSLLALGDTGGYIKEYRSNLGLDGYLAGDVLDIVSFAIFALIVYIFHLVVSIKVYHIHRSFSMVVLLLALITFTFALLASRSLMSLT
ncbi:hypothetical protein KY385_03240 [Candidatus Parcubacteria bacterium]|nr:hypothetical protein [Candidatus Parcubacteria bacterium]